MDSVMCLDSECKETGYLQMTQSVIPLKWACLDY